MEKINILYSEEVLNKRIKEMADELYSRFGDEEVEFICILKGAVFFFTDLLKNYKGDGRINFMRVSSYVGENSTGEVLVKIPVKEDVIKGKNVVIVEDIVDTGNTLTFLRKYMNDMGAKSVSEVVLLDKKARRVKPIEPTMTGFEIEDLFVIGYGLDYDEKYRNLPYIGVVVNE